MMRVLVLVAAVAAALFPVSPASAQDDFQTHLDAGLRHYESRQYADAAREFQAAFDIRPEPDLLYNVARSYERGVMRREAIDAYARFLELPGTTSEMRQRALAARNSLESELRAIEQRDQAQQTTTETETETPAESNDATTAPPPPPPEPSPLRPTGFALIGVGAAVAVVGGVFGGLALSANSDFEDATDRAEQLELRDDVNRNALLADVFVGVGVGVAVVGVILAIVGKPDTADQPSASITPTVGRDGAGLQLRTSF